MKRAKVSSVLIALFLVALVAAPLPATAQPASESGKRAEIMLSVSERACLRLGIIINATEANQTAMATIEGAGLLEAFEANVSIYEEAKGLIEEAKVAFLDGNYSLALNYTRQAMALLREAFKGINIILEQIGVGKEDLIQAQGLVEAARRHLERINRIEEVLPENAGDIRQLLEQAEGLLNVTEITSLLQQGNVTEVARRLAEANRLIAEAFRMVKAKAEDGLSKRVGVFVEKLEEVYEKVSEKLNSVGLNASEILANFSLIKQQIVDEVRDMDPKEIKEYVKSRLKEIGEYLHEFKWVLPRSGEIPRPKIADILSNPIGWKGKTVLIVGRYCDEEPPEGVPGPNCTKPPEEGSWIISDETGWVYVFSEHIPPRPSFIQALEMVVIGEVRVKTIDGNDVPYIRAKIVLPKPPPLPLVVLEKLQVSVQKGTSGRDSILNITVTNIANETVVFPDGAYGISIMRRIGQVWIPFYVPISILVLVYLEPGKSGSIEITLHKPPQGTYKAVSVGWLKESKVPVVGTAEFTLP